MFTLANFLLSRGDVTNATGWYRAGAERGEAKAQQAFAQCLATGRGVATNLAEAARWSALAAKTLNSNGVAETKATTNAEAVVSSMKVAPPASDPATNSSSTAFGALLAVISPAPLKVAAREVPSTPPRP
jgi:TPR repeat protein